jgi:hypothetical protein
MSRRSCKKIHIIKIIYTVFNSPFRSISRNVSRSGSHGKLPLRTQYQIFRESWLHVPLSFSPLSRQLTGSSSGPTLRTSVHALYIPSCQRYAGSFKRGVSCSPDLFSPSGVLSVARDSAPQHMRKPGFRCGRAFVNFKFLVAGRLVSTGALHIDIASFYRPGCQVVDVYSDISGFPVRPRFNLDRGSRPNP